MTPKPKSRRARDREPVRIRDLAIDPRDRKAIEAAAQDDRQLSLFHADRTTGRDEL